MPQVDRIKTKYTRTEVAQWLRDELAYQLNAEPNRNICEVLLADLEMENGSNFEYVWNNNFGNIGINTESQDYWTTKTNKFRSFSLPKEGMKAYVREIFRRKSLKNAALEGDIDGFVTALRDTKYCPDCEPSKIGPTLSKLVDTYKASNLFADLPTTIPKTSNWVVWASLGISAYILYKTVRIKPNRKLQTS
jgi:hypothetical protein